MEPTIQHDPEAGKFFTTVDGREGYLRYAHRSTETVDFQSTYVPSELRGKGLAGEIVERALEWAESEGKRVIPSCWYVNEYIKRHPRFESLRAEG